MSKLDRFIAKPITIELDGVELDIHPLEMKDLPLIMKLSSKNEDRQAEGFRQMIEKTLKKAVPDATTEELDCFSMKYFTEISNAIMEANGLKPEDMGGQIDTNIKEDTSA